jgi:glycosyltransferase involved in cell wall biosynthesis
VNWLVRKILVKPQPELLEPGTYFLIVGDGVMVETINKIFVQMGVQQRVHFAGVQQKAELCDHYHAMEVFVFTSKIETQGMVLAEAMAAGVPVIALDAPGAREIVQDHDNGRLLTAEDLSCFTAALSETFTLWQQESYRSWKEAAFSTARRFSQEISVEKVLALYENLLKIERKSRGLDDDTWGKILRTVKQEWEIWANRISAGIEALSESTKG